MKKLFFGILMLTLLLPPSIGRAQYHPDSTTNALIVVILEQIRLLQEQIDTMVQEQRETKEREEKNVAEVEQKQEQENPVSDQERERIRLNEQRTGVKDCFYAELFERRWRCTGFGG